MSNILVAGGAGYIGSRLVPALLRSGHKVSVVDLLWFGNYLSIPVIQRDLFDLREDDLRGYDCLIFLAGMSNDPMADCNPSKNFVSNAALPAYLAFIARSAAVKRFIYASSCSIYGYTNQICNEDSPTLCRSPYGMSKLQGEQGVLQAHDDKFSVIALRQGTVCGYSPRMRFDLIMNTMFKTAYLHDEVIVNNSMIWRPICDIEDSVSAFEKAIRVKHSVSGAFNVSSTNLTVGEVGRQVKEMMEKAMGRKITLMINNAEEVRNYRVSTQKAETVLGFRPNYCASRLLQGILDHRDEFGDFENDQFYNIRIFKKYEHNSCQY
jgi:nucleoside-diphosphate-sugar epimerase